ncbi:MAG TPA: hypothetical protein VN181_04450, partial [Thermoanaerobaculia bacterium]|nr:hypothetical protein [Thermoanaerobaculia bacterium]
ATFRNHPLFIFSPDDTWHHASYSTSFRRARLDDADFRTMPVIGVGRSSDHCCSRDLFLTFAGGSSASGGPWVFLGWFDTDEPGWDRPPPSKATRERYSMSIKAITDAFAGAQWQGAKLPRPLASIFNSSPPATTSQQPCE